MSSTELHPIAILAGGLATRLRPITETIPKALVPVAGEPFLFHQLRYVKEQGGRRVVLCTGFLGEQVEAAVGTGEAFGLEIEFAHDGAKLLGTGGALKAASSRLSDDFIVLYGDSYLPVDFMAAQRAYEARGLPALMTVFRNDNAWDKSNAELTMDGLVVYDKRNPTVDMGFIDYGLGVLARSILDDIPAGEPYDLADLYQRLSRQRMLAGLEVMQRFYEIGSPAGLAETENYIAGHRGAGPLRGSI